MRSLQTHSRQEHPHDRGDEPVAPAHDRRHELAQAWCAHAEGYLYSCKWFAAFLKRSPDTATAEDIRLFQLQLAETGMSIATRA
jgi:hypothetical protein